MHNPADSDIAFRSLDEERLLFGARDHWRRLICQRYAVELVSRNGHLRILGSDAEAVDAARGLVTRALEVLRHGDDGSGLERIFRDGHGAAEVDGSNGDGRNGQVLAGGIRARTEGQSRYVESLRDNIITIAVGPAGSGKTFLAVARAVAELRSGHYRKLVLARPAVEAGEKLGFLPGDMQAKVHPYLRPLYDALFSLLDPNQVRRYLETDVIEIVPLAYMRGRTLDKAFIILDEAQNTTPKQMKMFLTRMGEGSRIVVTGDATQTDLPPGAQSGLIHCIGVLGETKGIGVVRLTRQDIVRHPLVQHIVNAYEKDDAREAEVRPRPAPRRGR